MNTPWVYFTKVYFLTLYFLRFLNIFSITGEIITSMHSQTELQSLTKYAETNLKIQIKRTFMESLRAESPKSFDKL